MNSDTGGDRVLRRAGILAVTAAVAVLAAACGGSTSSSSAAGPAPGESAAFRQALAYVRCMRTHGVPDYPDPNANGTIALPSSANPNSSQMQAAGNACQHLQPGGAPSPAQARQNLALEVKMAQCMRAHGVPDFADPGANGQGSASSGVSKGESKTPRFQAALRTCQSLVHAPSKGSTP
jgi:hypothetical protein